MKSGVKLTPEISERDQMKSKGFKVAELITSAMISWLIKQSRSFFWMSITEAMLRTERREKKSSWVISQRKFLYWSGFWDQSVLREVTNEMHLTKMFRYFLESEPFMIPLSFSKEAKQVSRLTTFSKAWANKEQQRSSFENFVFTIAARTHKQSFDKPFL